MRPARARARHHHALHTALHHWEKACTLAQKYSLKVSPVEESLMEMLHPEGNIDTQWVDNVSALLREMIAALSAESASRKVRVRAATDALRAAAERLAAPEASRLHLLQDVRSSLHTLQTVNEGNNPAALFLSGDKLVSAHAAALLGVREQEAAVSGARDAAAYLLAHLAEHHEQLLQLYNNWPADASGRKLTRQSAITAGKSNANNRHGGERNAVGAGVWKRVRLKLEGRDDSQTTRRYALHDQVDHMIKEAVCSGNLCMMYEGWMAWV